MSGRGFVQRKDGSWLVFSGWSTSCAFESTTTDLSSPLRRFRLIEDAQDEGIRKAEDSVRQAAATNAFDSQARLQAFYEDLLEPFQVENPQLERQVAQARDRQSGDSSREWTATQGVAPDVPPRQEQTVFLVVYASERSEAQANVKRDEVLDLIPNPELRRLVRVDQSADYEGLREGWWVVVMPCAERSTATGEALFAKQNGLSAYIRAVRPKSGEPLRLNEAVGD